MQQLINFWYQDKQLLSYFFYPLHWLLSLLIKLRKICFEKGILKVSKIESPVIIIGNITAGGTGKSPLVVHLAQQLSKAGYMVGISSRGYGGKSSHYPVDVEIESSTAVVGDEPVMIKRQLALPVVVDPVRIRGVRHLQQKHGCNLIICDDGLQHYALHRTIELVVVDGERNFGNGLLMPFGPLREPVSRLQTVDGVLINNASTDPNIQAEHLFSMRLTTEHFIAVSNENKTLEIGEFIRHCQNRETTIHAVAAIGNPQRFFNQLESSGLNIEQHPFNDHHQFDAEDFDNMAGIIIMTEKDAVKCSTFATDDMWYLKVEVETSPSIGQFCIDLLEQKQIQMPENES